MDNLAVITARSGSKGLKDKNIRLLNGAPLMAYSIKAARESGCFKTVFVSTDSPEYAQIAKEFGGDASFLRSEHTSTDSANSWDAVREVVAAFKEMGRIFDHIMLLQPTSPLRIVEDIVNSFDLLIKKGASGIIGVTETDHSPLWCNTLPDSLSMDNFSNEKYCDLPRQELPVFYRINGAIYLVTREELENDPILRKNCYAYVMPKERSIDIDSELDFIIAEEMMRRTRMGERG